MKCAIHREFFDESCVACREEYLELKGANDKLETSQKRYKELTEERAKKLYEEILLQYIKGGFGEAEADRKAKGIIRRQCNIRGIPLWKWL